ncbi:MAG TPA: TonB family protein [Acidobacteriaceae bacterium]|jgi:protein TonB|nr:TonB family protein [Acidobacteriaceae bacterium]
MFEDSLVESAGRIRIHARRYVAGSFLTEAALLSTLVLLPYFFPEALPRRFLSVPLMTPPPPPAAPAPLVRAAPAQATEFLGAMLVAPGRIPHTWHTVVDPAPPGAGIPDFGGPQGATNPLSALGPLAPPTPRIRPARPSGPMRISEGVAAGQLIVPIQPQYPAIARAAGIQGTVTVAAVISTGGRIESLRVLSGPPLLVTAAVSAIRQARYRPWTLNRQAVEIETTIRVVFSLGHS